MQDMKIQNFIEIVKKSYREQNKERFLDCADTIIEAAIKAEREANKQTFNEKLFQIIQLLPEICGSAFIDAMNMDSNHNPKQRKANMIISDNDQLFGYLLKLSRKYSNEPEYKEIAGRYSFYHEKITSFDEFLNYCLAIVQKEGLELLEQSEKHMIYKDEGRILERRLEEKLTLRMKEFYSDTDFVSLERDKTKHYDLTRYCLHYHVGVARSNMSVGVQMIDGKLGFRHNSNEENKLAETFIEEIKNLPKYRLLVITQ